MFGPKRWVRSRLTLAAALILWPVPGGYGQQIAPVVVQANSDFVPIEVQAIDRITNQPIQGLTCNDFEVWEESLLARTVGCNRGAAAARDVLLLLDFNGGYGDEAALYTAPAVLDVLRPGDRAAAMWFAGGLVHLASGLTADQKEAGQRVLALVDSQLSSRKSFKRSGLYDAILSGAQFLSETPDVRRPLIVVVTHNREGKSDAMEADIVAALLKSSISLEAITVPQRKKTHGPLDADWRNLPWLNPSSADLPGNLGPERPRTFLADLFSVEPIIARVGGTAVRLDYERSRQIRDNKRLRYWDPDAVTLAIERELVQRVRNPFVLTIRRRSTEQPEFRRLEVRLTAEARRAHTAATVTAPSGYYTKSNGFGQ